MQAEDLWIDLDKDQIIKLCLYFNQCVYVLKQLAVSFHPRNKWSIIHPTDDSSEVNTSVPFWFKTSSNFSCKSDFGMKGY